MYASMPPTLPCVQRRWAWDEISNVDELWLYVVHFRVDGEGAERLRRRGEDRRSNNSFFPGSRGFYRSIDIFQDGCHRVNENSKRYPVLERYFLSTHGRIRHILHLRILPKLSPNIEAILYFYIDSLIVVKTGCLSRGDYGSPTCLIPSEWRLPISSSAAAMQLTEFGESSCIVAYDFRRRAPVSSVFKKSNGAHRD